MKNKLLKTSYSEAIRDAFDYLLTNFEETFIIGQGVWSPWYVGNSMSELEKKYGKERVIDTPTSESAITGIAVGASLCDKKPIVVHPRMDFSLYAMDTIVNQAAKWHYMFGGKANANLTVRTIINRGGEQGAQHSQALHSIFAHIPGLKVVMPYSVQDARDLLIASVISKDPVIYIDDRWLYENESYVSPISESSLRFYEPKAIKKGEDITIVSSGYSTHISLIAAEKLKKHGIEIELIDLRVISPLKIDAIIKSVKKTRRLLCVDGGWAFCGMSAEIIASILENIEPKSLITSPKRITLPAAPAPSTKLLEDIYYPDENDVIKSCKKMMNNE